MLRQRGGVLPNALELRNERQPRFIAKSTIRRLQAPNNIYHWSRHLLTCKVGRLASEALDHAFVSYSRRA